MVALPRPLSGLRSWLALLSAGWTQLSGGQGGGNVLHMQVSFAAGIPAFQQQAGEAAPHPPAGCAGGLTALCWVRGAKLPEFEKQAPPAPALHRWPMGAGSCLFGPPETVSWTGGWLVNLRGWGTGSRVVLSPPGGPQCLALGCLRGCPYCPPTVPARVPPLAVVFDRKGTETGQTLPRSGTTNRPVQVFGGCRHASLASSVCTSVLLTTVRAETDGLFVKGWSP